MIAALLAAALVAQAQQAPQAPQRRDETARAEHSDEGNLSPGEKPENAEHEESVADHIFHHVQDQVWLPLGFWAGGHHVDISITKHVINMWIAVACCSSF